MKKYFLYIIIAIIGMYSCKQMDSEYKDFIVPNGYVYPQKADSLVVYAGFNKLRLKWLKPKSPSVKYAMVYWNNYSDSLKVEWPANKDTIYVDITDLNETSYTLYVKNFDLKGNVSLPSEGTGTPYGVNYLISAADRTYNNALRNTSAVGTINWGVKTSDLVYTEVRYITTNGTKSTARINYDKDILNIPNIKPGELFEYRSVFLPKNGIDSIAREWKISEKPFLYKYPRNIWTVTARNGNHAWTDGGGGQPQLLFDGNTLTGWHSKVGTSLPQVIITDMKESLMIDNIIIVPPAQTTWRYLNKVALYLKDTPFDSEEPNTSWGIPTSTVTYNGETNFKIQLPEAQSGKYLALVFLDSKSNTYISFMELEVYGY